MGEKHMSTPGSYEEYLGKVNAPEFPSNMDWLNVESALSLKKLVGRIVILDFWTFC